MSESIWDRMDRIPRQVYYTILLIALCVTLVRPLGLPISISGETRELYDIIEELPDGSVVLVDIAFGAGGYPELGPAMTAVMHHISQRDLKAIIMTLVTEGPQMYNIIIEREIDPEQAYGKVYGDDFVFLGYNAGGVTTMAALANNMRLYGTDYRDTPLDDLSIMDGIETYQDIDLVITITTASGGISSPADWVQQWATPYNAPLACVVLKMMMPTVSPYYGTGQVVALMPGAGGSAEYELLVDRPGDGLRSTDAISVSHILVIGLVVLGNLSMFGKRGGTS